MIDTRRFGPHSKGDDPRTSEELEVLRAGRDPIEIAGARLDPDARSTVSAEVEVTIGRAFDAAPADPFPDLD